MAKSEEILAKVKTLPEEQQRSILQSLVMPILKRMPPEKIKPLLQRNAARSLPELEQQLSESPVTKSWAMLENLLGHMPHQKREATYANAKLLLRSQRQPVCEIQ